MICVNRFAITNPKTGGKIVVPCGRCYACQQSRRSSWAFRNQVEFQYSVSAFFVTLTYDDDHLRKLPVADFNLVLPDRSNYQKWLKRMRKALSPIKLRYFLCQEFGDKTYRPHYHAILYLDSAYSLTDMYSLVCSTWKSGHVSVDYVTPARIHYMTKYICKQFRNIKTSDESYNFIFKQEWENKELQERYQFEFILKKYSFTIASNGLGSQLLKEPAFVNWFWSHIDPEDGFPLYSIDGKSYVLPRYYIKKLIPSLWKPLIVQTLTPYKYEKNLREKACESNLSRNEYVANVNYLQSRRLAILQSNLKVKSVD